MSPVVVRSLMGVAGLGIASVGSYGIYYASKNTSNATNIKEQLVYEKLKIIPFENKDLLWVKKANEYMKEIDTNKKIDGVDISIKTEFTKLINECRKLLEVNLKDSEAGIKLVQARRWCVYAELPKNAPVVFPEV